MNRMDDHMDRLEAEGQRMVELSTMSEKKLRAQLTNLLEKAGAYHQVADTASLADIAFALAELRGEMGLLMRECEIRTLRLAGE